MMEAITDKECAFLSKEQRCYDWYLEGNPLKQYFRLDHRFNIRCFLIVK